MNIGSLGCKSVTKEQEKEILREINAKPKEYKIETVNKSFNDILEVYKFCKKENTDDNLYISNDLCTWGKVKALVSMKLKDVKYLVS